MRLNDNYGPNIDDQNLSGSSTMTGEMSQGPGSHPTKDLGKFLCFTCFLVPLPSSGRIGPDTSWSIWAPPGLDTNSRIQVLI